jgi:hypothetical protein
MNITPTRHFELLIPADIALETAISMAHASVLACERCGNTQGVREASEELVRLVRDRSPTAVLQMELARGLRK